MCGITGIFDYSHSAMVDTGLLEKMRDVMVHRGPDDFGLWMSRDGFTGFAHRRLSIIDLSKNASQPMSNEDESIWIVCNGEIYNHAEIRKVLEAEGHRFKTDHSDTEVIIHSFEQWGIECVKKFRGMFAFAIWDCNTRELWLVRDRIGVKPLYFTDTGKRFIFASEVKSILADPVIERKVNEEALYHYLSFLTTPAPNTMFAGINKLPPASYLKVSDDGMTAAVRYWDVFENLAENGSLTEAEIAHRLIEELKTSVYYRSISDVPVGIFLSGGIDSSLNAILFSQGSAKKVNTFTIGYEGNNPSYLNEFKYARQIADSINANYFEKILNIDDMINFLDTLVFHQDEPLADPVCFPLYHVSKLARDNGITVCQVGEGSDELFMGYPGWIDVYKLYGLNSRGIPAFVKRAVLSLLNASGRRYTYSAEWLRRAVNNQTLFWGGAEAFFETEKKQLLSARLKSNLAGLNSYDIIRQVYDRFEEKSPSGTPLAWMTYLDINFRLPELLLMRVDKMSMAVSLEARVPFLDHKFVEFAMSIPENIKIRGNELKYILKKAVEGILPDEIIHREKQGFGVPIYEWFFEKLGVFAKQKLSGFASKTDYFNMSHIEKLFEARNAQKIWFILNFALWYEEWIEKV